MSEEKGEEKLTDVQRETFVKLLAKFVRYVSISYLNGESSKNF